ncbi:hypothetical protein SSYM_0460, partial [Serratia symbiotica str. Tucson]
CSCHIRWSKTKPPQNRGGLNQGTTV